MQQKISLKLLPSEAGLDTGITTLLSKACNVIPERITGYQVLKRSLDARSRQAWVNLSVIVYIDEPYLPTRSSPVHFRDVHNSRHRVIIVGAGPAGLFAALRLIELGIQPYILERGKDVRSRRRDLAAMNKDGVINPESNYCFGEGGAGTYSDGKLYTRSNKRGDIQRILNLFVRFGAADHILFDAHPHIGTNKLPQIITAMRAQILACGGQVLFEHKVTDFIIDDGACKGVKVSNGETYYADAVILATGHSARDIFHLLNERKIHIEMKPFALGVRIEHPQALIDRIQYHLPERGEYLPPSSYSLVHQVEDRGVFSFCMCPGGIIAPAATSPGEIVVNGWSPSKRNNPFANSGMVVTVEEKDVQPFKKGGRLAGLLFQQSVEQAAYNAGGGHLKAPAQRMVDFVQNKTTASLPVCSYLPGVEPADLRNVLPPFIHHALKESFKAFGGKMRGYLTNDAIVVATESRTSSPVRIPRDANTLQHPGLKNLYPCAEGAGYAGGIVSAAMDGERVASMIAMRY